VANRGRSGDEQVHLVTSAQKAHSEAMHGRTRRYLISMGIRTVCLVLAIFVAHGWLRLIFIAGAIALPWFAVVLANAGPVQDDEQPEFIQSGPRELGPADHTGEDLSAGADQRQDIDNGVESANDDVPPRGGASSSETMSGRRHGAA
jgi:hypothetical protein